ncbi:RNA polymerase sigma-70 factor [Parafilimonas terrae]|uniref:RNA polymerase sigma-70 factor, ECF subfamily n=1 Tax=Parafilimonas terrae TaxID=1465490 RepID=A0A1I5XH38_9BACT|nr:RNA polymerase sigma-70 factor [Parafilimonas terrae]SFQ31289.1 RNA polymerase sigma-70 factor, ECF subfamily [Parafilimonas terrae]
MNKPLNHSSVKEVFYQYYPPLCLFAGRLVNNEEAAADITEEVFIKLWHKQPDFSKYKNIKAVLYIAVKNACLNYLQQQKRNTARQYAFAYFTQNESEGCIQNEIIRAEILREVYAALQQLPKEQRRVMQLLFTEGLDSKAVAAALNISIHTVKKHKLNGLKAIRKKLGVPGLIIIAALAHV